MWKLINLIIIVLIGLTLCEERNGWVDPGDMLRYDFLSKSMKPSNLIMSSEMSEKRNQLSSNQLTNGKDYSSTNDCPFSCDDCDRKYATRFVKILLDHLKPQSNLKTEDGLEEFVFDVEISLLEKEFNVLNDFVKRNGPSPSLSDIDVILSSFIKSAKLHSLNQDNMKSGFGSGFDIHLNENVIKYLSTIVTAIISIILLRKMRILHFLILLTIMIILVSLYMEFYNLLERANAEHSYQRSQLSGIPKECQPSQLSMSETVSRFFYTMIHEDKCLTYYKTMAVNPLFEITPTKVIMTLLEKIVTQFSSIFGKSISAVYDGLVEGRSFLGSLAFLSFTSVFALTTIWIVFPTLMLCFCNIFLWSRGGNRRIVNETIQNSASNQRRTSYIEDVTPSYVQNATNQSKPSSVPISLPKTPSSIRPDNEHLEDDDEFEDASDILNISSKNPQTLT